MKRRVRRPRTPLLASVAALVLVGTAGAAAVTTPASGSVTTGTRPWLRPGLSVDQRIDGLLAAMTLDEKIAELHADKCTPYESCLPANARLGLPEIVLEDDSTGVAAGMRGVTALPATIAASASWDQTLIKKYGQVIGDEERAKGVDVALAPTVNILRAPEWGRSFESLGEDPYLSAQMGTADMGGIQTAGIPADVKHFAVYNQETDRKTVSAQVSSRALHEIYLPAFAATIKSGAGSIMASYNALNGVLNSQNPYMLQTVLRDELGFQGFVRSDGNGTYSTIPSANAGLDIQVKGTDYFGAPLKAAVQAGQVAVATINSMVSSVLREMFDFNLFRRTWGNGSLTQNVITPADTRTALDSAEQGTVLLKNKGGALPLSTTADKSIAVVGQEASPGHAEGGGSGDVQLPFLVSPVQGIHAADPGANVSYSAGLPAASSLPAVPAANLSPAYKAGAAYSGTLTPDVTGQYTLAVQDGAATGALTPSTLSVDGRQVLNTPEGQVFGVGSVNLQAGHHYQIQISGPSQALSWATPAALSAAIAPAVTAARHAQVAVVVVGDQESEAADRVDLNLSAGQDQLVEAVAAANPHTIVVVNSGAPVLMPWLDRVSGVVESWYPGEEDGTALAAVLFGKVNPSGKLPMTFPAAAGQGPVTTPAQFPGVNGVANYSENLQVGYRWYDAHGVKPLFPFGYGLSYSTFRFSNLSISRRSTTSLGTVQVGATVTNIGSRTGAEVAQLYLNDPAGSGEPPLQLKGFQKVTLRPGQSTRVHFDLTPQALATWNTSANMWVTGEGTYHVMVGDSSANLPLTGSVRVDSTTGVRAVTLQAPSTIHAGQPATVSATLDAGGDLNLKTAKLRLTVPGGWQVKLIGPDTAGKLSPNQKLTVTWQVTPPPNMQANISQLTALATFAAAGNGQAGSAVARTQITIG